MFTVLNLIPFFYKIQNGLNMGNVILWYGINFCVDPMIHIDLKKEYSTVNKMVVLLGRGHL